MSPELIDPQKFGFDKFCPTKCSDCYALRMVIYETVNGHFPFHQHVDFTVIVKVMAGKRPPREAGFTDGLWEMLGLCWAPQPKSRPTIEDVLQCLGGVLDSTQSLSPCIDEETDGGGDDWDPVSNYSGVFCHFVSSARFYSPC